MIVQHEFINITAHELRTPTQPILSATDILRSKIIDISEIPKEYEPKPWWWRSPRFHT